jgi:lactoylglutathione lyase
MARLRTWIRIVCFTGIALAGFALGGWANQKAEESSNFATQTIDLGMVVSDIDKSLAFYKDVLGFTEVPGFKVPGQFGEETGLSNKLDLDVHVLVLGSGPTATKLKLMQFKTAPGARVDNSFIHSSYGYRYLTIAVKNVNAAVERANKAGGKLVAKCPVPLPTGFPEGLGLANYRDPDGNLIELVGPWKK